MTKRTGSSRAGAFACAGLATWIAAQAACDAGAAGASPGHPAGAGIHADAAGHVADADGHVQASAGGLEAIEPRDPAHPLTIDLGRLDSARKVDGELRMINREGRALQLHSVQAGCSCTSASLVVLDAAGKETVHGAGPGLDLRIPDGAEVRLRFQIDPAQSPTKNSPKLVLVRMISDSVSRPYQTAELRFHVHEPITAAPASIWMRQVAENGEARGSTELTNVLSSGEELDGVLQCPEPLEARLERSQLGVVTLWKLEVTVKPPVALGTRSYEILLSMRGADGAPQAGVVRVPVLVEGVPDVGFQPDLLLLKRPADGGLPAAQTELATHLAGHRLRVVGSRLEGELADALEFACTPLDADGEGRATRFQLRLRALRALDKQPAAGKLVVLLDDPNWRELELRYFKHAD